MGHRKYAASAAHRFIACTASHELERSIKGTGSSKYAAEGTRAHAFAAYLLTGGTLTPGEQIAYEDGDETVSTIVDSETLESIAPYLEFVRQNLENGAVDLRVEFAADVIPGKLGGTADAVFRRRDTLHVCDLKYGKGVLVDPEENAQLMCYALACLPHYPGVKQVCLNIIQPRARGEIVKQWRCSIAYLSSFRVALLEAVKNIDAGNTEFIRGEHCQFCKALHGCPSYFEAIEPVPKSAGMVTVEQRAYILDHLEDIRRLCKAVEDEARDLLLNGATVPGWKLVQKQGRSKWNAEAFEALRLTIGMTETKLIGITEARKIIGKEVDRYTVKESSGVTIARDTDKRPAAVVDGSSFDDLTCEE